MKINMWHWIVYLGITRVRAQRSTLSLSKCTLFTISSIWILWSSELPHCSQVRLWMKTSSDILEGLAFSW